MKAKNLKIEAFTIIEISRVLVINRQESYMLCCPHRLLKINYLYVLSKNITIPNNTDIATPTPITLDADLLFIYFFQLF